MKLRRVAENLWVSESEIRMMPGVSLPLRMVVIRIDSDLWLHSPVALDGIEDDIDALGDVRWVVNPNSFHGIWSADAMDRWPSATLYSSSERLAARKLPPFEPLDESAYAHWDGAIDSAHIDGLPTIDESVFFHRPSKSLIVTDLLFNLQKKPRGVLAPVMFRCMGTWSGPAQSRLLMGFMKDKQAAARSLDVIRSWDFERIIMAHGDIIEDDAQQVFAEATKRMQNV